MGGSSSNVCYVNNNGNANYYFGNEHLGSPPPRIPLLPDRVGQRAESRARRGRKARPSGASP